MVECSKGTFINLPFVIKTLVFILLSGRFTQVLLYTHQAYTHTCMIPFFVDLSVKTIFLATIFRNDYHLKAIKY